MTGRPLIIDSDGGVDDALALLLACASPELDIRAVTTVAGNVPLAQATDNSGLILGVAGRSDGIELAAGHGAPLLRPMVTAEEVHGDDGLGGVTRKPEALSPEALSPEALSDVARVAPSGRFAPELLVEAARAHGPALAIVAIGPLTNLAAAWLAAPEAMAGIGLLAIMGGAVSGRGNVTAGAEFNFYVDPEAAAVVMASAMPKTLLPLEATHQVLLRRDQIGDWSVAHPSATADFVRAITAHYMDFTRDRGQGDGCHLHDALAVATLLDAGLFRFEAQSLAVETQGALAAGMSLVDRRAGATPNAQVCVEVDEAGFLELLRDRVWRRAAGA